MRKARPRSWGLAILLAIIAFAFVCGALIDVVTGNVNPIGPAVLAALFGLLALNQVRRALSTQVPPPNYLPPQGTRLVLDMRPGGMVVHRDDCPVANQIRVGSGLCPYVTREQAQGHRVCTRCRPF
jgi:hypothetical protein